MYRPTRRIRAGNDNAPVAAHRFQMAKCRPRLGIGDARALVPSPKLRFATDGGQAAKR